MEPTRDSHATLVDLLDRILDKGLVLYADIIVSVAGIPLIGVNLRAALAGMETMLKYGVMQDWDERIRAWERENRKERELPLASGEQVVLKMLGSYLYSQGIYTSWRQGYFYVTDRRIALYLLTFGEVLFQASLQSIKGLAMRGGKHLSGAEREHLCLLLESGEVARLHASDSRQLRQAIERGMAALGLTWEEMPAFAMYDEKAAKLLTDGEELACAGKMWHLMALPTPGSVITDTWQSGHLYITNRRLCWWYDFEGKLAFEIPLETVAASTVGIRDVSSTLRQKRVFDVIYETEAGKKVASFSGDGLAEWEEALNRIIARQGTPLGEETDTCPQCGQEAPVNELLHKGCDRCGWVSPSVKKEMLRATAAG